MDSATYADAPPTEADVRVPRWCADSHGGGGDSGADGGGDASAVQVRLSDAARRQIAELCSGGGGAVARPRFFSGRSRRSLHTISAIILCDLGD